MAITRRRRGDESEPHDLRGERLSQHLFLLATRASKAQSSLCNAGGHFRPPPGVIEAAGGCRHGSRVRRCAAAKGP